MGKKSIGRHGGAKPAFRESDFAGRPAQEQAELSGSLNNLSQQIAATRQLLQDIQVTSVAAVGEPAAPSSSAGGGNTAHDGKADNAAQGGEHGSGSAPS